MKRIAIRFPLGFSSGPTNDLYHRISWFADDLHRPIVKAGLGEVNESGRVHGVVFIDIKDNHNMGKSKEIIRKLLAKHRLTADGTMTIESPLQPSKHQKKSD
jgi:hypothetical protein